MHCPFFTHYCPTLGLTDGKSTFFSEQIQPRRARHSSRTLLKADEMTKNLLINTKQKCEARDTTKSIWKQVYKDV